MAQRLDAEGFEALCAPYAPMVYRHCLMMLGHPQEAEDAAQETMLRAFRAFSRKSGRGVAAWLFTIAHNTCLDVLKSARYRRESATLDPWREAHGDPQDPSPGPEGAYVRSAEDERLWAAVGELSERQQLLITLFYGENLSYTAIAQATGLKEGTVKSALNRAKEALRQRLTEEDAP